MAVAVAVYAFIRSNGSFPRQCEQIESAIHCEYCCCFCYFCCLFKRLRDRDREKEIKITQTLHAVHSVQFTCHISSNKWSITVHFTRSIQPHALTHRHSLSIWVWNQFHKSSFQSVHILCGVLNSKRLKRTFVRFDAYFNGIENWSVNAHTDTRIKIN